MDLRLTKTGRIFYRVDSTLGAILCEALPSVFERVEATPKLVHVANAASAAIRNVETPEWIVGKSPTDAPVIILRAGRTELNYTGSVEGASDNFKRAGFEIPRDVLERYRRLVESQQDPEAVAERERSRRADLELAQRLANNGE